MSPPDLRLPDPSWPGFGPCYAVDPGTLAGLSAVCRPGGRILDVGCNVGLTTCLAALSVGPEGAVTGFDGNPDALAAGEQLAACNGLQGRVHFVRALVGEAERASEPFALVRAGTQTGSHRGPRGEGEEPLMLPMTTLDAHCLLRDLRPDAVKVDVEGGEVRVLQGSPWLLRDVRPSWVIEVHPRHMLARVGSTAEELVRILTEAGYRLSLLPEPEAVTLRPGPLLGRLLTGEPVQILARPQSPAVAGR